MTSQQRRLVGPSYVAAASLIIFPIFDQVMQLVPTVKLHDPRWRFGAAGLLSNLLILPLVGMMIIFFISATLDQRIVQRVFSILGSIIALVLLAATGLFLLDAIQVRSILPKAAQSSWAVATSTAIVKLMVAIVTILWFAIAAFRNGRSRPGTQKPNKATLVVGTPARVPSRTGT